MTEKRTGIGISGSMKRRETIKKELQRVMRLMPRSTHSETAALMAVEQTLLWVLNNQAIGSLGFMRPSKAVLVPRFAASGGRVIDRWGAGTASGDGP